jgi:hypothetical protein
MILFFLYICKIIFKTNSNTLNSEKTQKNVSLIHIFPHLFNSLVYKLQEFIIKLVNWDV